MPGRPSSKLLAGAILAMALLGGSALFLLMWQQPDGVTTWSSSDLEPVPPRPEDGDSALEGTRSMVVPDDFEAMRSGESAGEDAAIALVTLRGRVVGPRQQPVAGATVHLSFAGTGHERLKKPTQTSSAGTFAVRGPLRPSTTVTVLVLHREFAPSQVSRRLRATGTGDEFDLGDIAVGDGAGVRGSVLLAEGGHAADAVIDVVPDTGGSALWSPEARVRVQAVPTDAQGNFRLEHLPPGSYRFVARAPGRVAASSDAVVVLDGDTKDLPPIVLPPGCRLVGAVVDRRGQGIAKARVTLAQLSPPSGAQQRVLTAADGSFEFDNLRRTRCEIQVFAIGFVSRGLRLDLTEAEKHVRVELDDGLRVDGCVVAASTGAAIDTFAVQARRVRSLPTVDPGKPTPPPPPPPIRQSGSWQTAPQDPGPMEAHPGGMFTCSGLDEGVYAVDVKAPGHVMARSHEVEVRLGHLPPRIEVALERGHTVRGRVVRAGDGAAVAGARLEAIRLGPDDRDRERTLGPTVARAISDGDGSFAMTSVGAGSYALRTTAAGLEVATTGPISVAGDVSDLRIEVAPHAALHGTVRGIPDGRSADVTVVAFADQRTVKTARVGDDGTYRLAPLRPAPYHVRAYLADSRSAIRHLVDAVQVEPPPQADVTVSAGQDQELSLDLRLVPLGRLAGTVHVNGIAAAGYLVRAESLPSSPRNKSRRLTPVAQQFVEANGSFALDELEAGAYQMVVTSASKERVVVYRADAHVVADTATEIDLDIGVASLEGRVVTPEDGGPVDGVVRLRPAGVEPDPVAEYAARVDEIRAQVREGRFRFEVVPTGSFVLEHSDGTARKPVRTEVTLQRGEHRSLMVVAGEKL
ncbi:MAG: carboxypeptidase-like regulatory domain-containing protein [Planctomycetota bacterium]